MPSKKHECGKRYTQVRDVYGKFRGFACTRCRVMLPKPKKNQTIA